MVADDNGGDVQTGSGLSYATQLAQIDPTAIGQEAAQRAVQLLGAKPIKTQKLDLVLPPRSSRFLDIATLAVRARALFAGSLNEDRFALITIVDDGLPRINTTRWRRVPANRLFQTSNGLYGFLHNFILLLSGTALQ